MEKIEIYFRDLRPEVQEQIKKAYGINQPEDMNWDSIPLMVLPIEQPEDCPVVRPDGIKHRLKIRKLEV